MLTARNSIAVILSIMAGILLIVSGTRGPVGIYEIILKKLPMFITDALILSVATIVAFVLILVSSLGGFTVIAGGYMIYKNHVRTGKLSIGLGAGVGIPWLLLMLFTLMITGEPTSIITQHSIIGWAGIILSFVARYIAK